MTPTPIPRTLALTLYGDLDVSVLDELPPGRKPVRTEARTESRRRQIYDFLKAQIADGRQAYVVYPLVEESELIDLKPATDMAHSLPPGWFFGPPQVRLPGFRVAGLLPHAALLEEARLEAQTIIAEDAELRQTVHRGLRQALLTRWRGKLDLASVG